MKPLEHFLCKGAVFFKSKKDDTQINVSLEGPGIFVISHAETNGLSETLVLDG